MDDYRSSPLYYVELSQISPRLYLITAYVLLSNYLSIYPFIHLSIHPSIYLYLSTYLSISIHLSIYLYLSTYLSLPEGLLYQRRYAVLTEDYFLYYLGINRRLTHIDIAVVAPYSYMYSCSCDKSSHLLSLLSR